MIQHLYGISQVNHVYDDQIMYMMIYGGLFKRQYRGLWGLLKSQYRGETKIKVENEEHVRVMEDEIGKKLIQKEIGTLVLLM